MRVLILYQQVPNGAKDDVSDVIDEAKFVKEMLENAGHKADLCDAFQMNLEATKAYLQMIKPDVVFNLMEELDGGNVLNPIGAMLLEHLNIPFTGSPSATLATATNKLAAKRIMGLAGLYTPDFLTCKDILSDKIFGGRWIIKPIQEDASAGILYSSVVDGKQLRDKFVQLGNYARLFFAEEYIDGKEVFVSLLYNPKMDCMQALSPTEIVYIDHPEYIPKIMSYDAKWNSDNCVYKHDSKALEGQSMIWAVTRAAEDCASAFGIKGYARIDIRMCGSLPMIIDVNANPHLGKDSYIIDSAERSKISQIEFVSRILGDLNGR